MSYDTRPAGVVAGAGAGGGGAGAVAGIMSFAAVIVSALPSSEAGVPDTLAFVVLALAMGLGVGAFNGALVALLRVNSLVTTIGMNSLMLGITMHVTRGFSQQAPPPLNKFGVGKLLGVPLTLYVMIVIAAIAIFVLEKTTVGRRFIATSVNPDAALTVGIRLDWYRVATYAVAGFCYAAAGILLAGYVLSPTVFSGMPYLLATVAAVVVGGNPIGGGLRGTLGVLAGDQDVNVGAERQRRGQRLAGGVLYRRIVMFGNQQSGHLQKTPASFFSLDTSSATSLTLTPPLRPGGSEVLRISRWAARSTP